MLVGQLFHWACLPSSSYVQVGQVMDGLQEMVGPLFLTFYHLSPSRRSDKAFFCGSGTLPTGQAPDPKCLWYLYLYGVCSHLIGQSKSQGQSQGWRGPGLHRSTDAWRSDPLEVFLVAIWHRSQKWKSRSAVRRLYNNPEKKWWWIAPGWWQWEF